MKIKDVEAYHTNQDVLSLDLETTVLDASIEMSRRNIGSVMVTEGDMMAGIATERDFMIRVIAQKLDPASTHLADIMTTDIKTAFPDDDVDRCVIMMEEGKFRHLPVLGDMGQVVSMLSQRDFIRLGL